MGYRDRVAPEKRHPDRLLLFVIQETTQEVVNMEKNCKLCDLSLDVSMFEKNRRVCKVCRSEQRKEKHSHICELCGSTFTTAKQVAKFCSLECTGMTRRRRVKKSCSYCGNGIEVLHGNLKWEYHYCNQRCRSEHLKVLLLSENNPNWDRTEKECDGCEKVIQVRPFDLKNTVNHFCSNDCYKANIGRFYSGENNSNWNFNLSDEERLDTRRYPEYYKWRSEVYERDDYTCQCCASNKSGSLIAHHIYNYSEHKKLRVNVDNGITLCKHCHLEFHKENGFKNNDLPQLDSFIKKYNNQKALI